MRWSISLVSSVRFMLVSGLVELICGFVFRKVCIGSEKWVVSFMVAYLLFFVIVVS